MAYLFTYKLNFPLNKYKVNSYKFRQKCYYDNVLWGLHLGEDINKKAGIQVKAVGKGRVVCSALKTKKNKKKDWGNIIVIAHKNPKTKKVFYSLYAHLGKRLVKKGNKVNLGKKIGLVGKANTIQNGWWNESHLHFAIYKGEWQSKKKILPGYYKKSQQRTRLRDWVSPTKFIRNYVGQIIWKKNY